MNDRQRPKPTIGSETKPRLKPTELVTKLVESLKPLKLIILDTNVLIHNPQALFSFKENHVFIPNGVIRELDNNKKGVSDKARNARAASNLIKRIISGKMEKPEEKLKVLGNAFSLGENLGHLFVENPLNKDLSRLLDTYPKKIGDKVDHEILLLAYAIDDRFGKNQIGSPYSAVILVSKDTNVFILGKALELSVEDYESDMVTRDTDYMPSGMQLIPNVGKLAKPLQGKEGGGEEAMLEMSRPTRTVFYRNMFVYDGNGFQAMVVGEESRIITLRKLRNYKEKHMVVGIRARDEWQNAAINALTNPEIHCVTLVGNAGTGKTLLAVASAIQQHVFFGGRYEAITFTRSPIPIGEDEGFLPGTAEEKLDPWMGALHDNLQIIERTSQKQKSGEPFNPPRVKRSDRNPVGHEDRRESDHSNSLEAFVEIKSMNFMRGRTLESHFLIIDEAQNLTAKQVKTLVSRAGNGTKVVLLGNMAQIDTPYLTEYTSGLPFIVSRFLGKARFAHVSLEKVHRSELAEMAEELL
ncbi:MAG: PhoH family protein [Candidatus Moranbacteria bacterium]|nr:PhoH family protein [Candidatus Moranbacteria bacterium]